MDGMIKMGRQHIFTCLLTTSFAGLQTSANSEPDSSAVYIHPLCP